MDEKSNLIIFLDVNENLRFNCFRKKIKTFSEF